MLKKIILLTAFLVLVAGSAFAQEKSVARYAPGREQLAEDTFRQLVQMSSNYDQLNMAADLATCEKAIKDHPELFTAMLENFIFAYCHVPDSLKTPENLLVNKLDGKSYYTLRSDEKWDELGAVYSEKRMAIRKEYADN